MRQNAATHLTVALLALSLSGIAASAQAPSLQEQLAAQYKTAKLVGSGTSVVEPGTLLSVQKGGVMSLPWRALVLCPAKFQDNVLHPPGGFCVSLQNYFKKGDKVYPLKVDVDLKKAKITFRVVSCDQCNQVDPPSGFKGEVVFEFAKGYLEKAAAGEVEDTIGQVFAVSTDDAQQGQGQQQDQGQQQGQAPQTGAQNQQPDQQPDQQQAEPQNIALGMTTDQVQAVLGKPEKTVNLGAKQIYVYKDLKVTFQNGKVSDVQ